MQRYNDLSYEEKKAVCSYQAKIFLDTMKDVKRSGDATFLRRLRQINFRRLNFGKDFFMVPDKLISNPMTDKNALLRMDYMSVTDLYSAMYSYKTKEAAEQEIRVVAVPSDLYQEIVMLDKALIDALLNVLCGEHDAEYAKHIRNHADSLAICIKLG